jgi:hypothetical protein
MKIILLSLLLLTVGPYALGQTTWRPATEKELEKAIPKQAPVVNEHIETEMRSASGVTDGHGKFIAAVVLITAGYSAEGKYSYFFTTQVPIKVGDIAFSPGDYLFGSKRVQDDTLTITFYEAATGKLLGSVDAKRETKRGAIRSIQVVPPQDGKGSIKIGRFAFDYSQVK